MTQNYQDSRNVIHPVPPGAPPRPGYNDVTVTDRGRAHVRPDSSCTTCHGRGTMRVVRPAPRCPTCHRTDEGDRLLSTIMLCSDGFHAPDAVATRATAAAQGEHCNCVRARVVRYFARQPAPRPAILAEAPRPTVGGAPVDPIELAMRGELTGAATDVASADLANATEALRQHQRPDSRATLLARIAKARADCAAAVAPYEAALAAVAPAVERAGAARAQLTDVDDQIIANDAARHQLQEWIHGGALPAPSFVGDPDEDALTIATRDRQRAALSSSARELDELHAQLACMRRERQELLNALANYDRDAAQVCVDSKVMTPHQTSVIISRIRARWADRLAPLLRTAERKGWTVDDAT